LAGLIALKVIGTALADGATASTPVNRVREVATVAINLLIFIKYF
jgi:hypothetical protein